MSPSALLQHFRRVSWRDTGCLIPDWDPDLATNVDSPLDAPFTIEEVDHALASMKLKAAPGPNGLSPGMIKSIFTRPHGKLYLLRLFNRYFLYFILVHFISSYFLFLVSVLDVFYFLCRV